MRTPLVTVPGARPFRLPLWRAYEAAPGADRSRHRGHAGARPVGAGCGQYAGRAESDYAGRHAQKIGTSEYTIQLNNAPSIISELGDLPIKNVGGAMVYIRDVAQVRDAYPPQTNIVHVEAAAARC